MKTMKYYLAPCGISHIIVPDKASSDWYKKLYEQVCISHTLYNSPEEALLDMPRYHRANVINGLYGRVHYVENTNIKRTARESI